MLDLVRRDPFKAALIVTTAKTVAADLLVQLAMEQQDWEPRRTALFAAFGFAYQGVVQYFVVNIVLERIFPGQLARAVVAKCAAMNGVADPFFLLADILHPQGNDLQDADARLEHGTLVEPPLRHSSLVTIHA